MSNPFLRSTGQQMKLISVIIPIYKVEKELRRCVDSVLNQTYRNLEIILVDDGSPDKCGEIADEYAVVDSGIRVIHKHNGGISSARNAGLNVAKGDYISFVDSDDWIEPNMLEKMISAIKTYDTKIVMCGIMEETEEKITIWGMEETTILSGKEVVTELIEDKKIHNYVWNVLYKRSVLEGLSFEEGQIFEDIRFSFRPVSRTSKVVFIKDVLYHYVRRSGSVLGQEKLYLQCEFVKARCVQARGALHIDRDFYMGIVCKSLLGRMVSLKNMALKSPLSQMKKISKTIKADLTREWKYWNGIFNQYEKINLRKYICLTVFFNMPLCYYCMVQIARKLRG